MLAPVTKKKDPVPVDFDLLLKEIHAKIGEIVLTKVDASTEVSGKEPIQLLYVSFNFLLMVSQDIECKAIDQVQQLFLLEERDSIQLKIKEKT